MVTDTSERKTGDSPVPRPARRRARGNGATAASLVIIVSGMVGLAYAAEPLYRAFCQITGFGGTTQTAEAAPTETIVSDRVYTVQFDANVNNKLPWRFKPVQREVKVLPGQEALAFYEATNISDQPIVGTAVFNVAPFKAGSYFNKIQCFCFTEQVLKPGESVVMPVTFFVDPDMLADANAADVSVITLSYTFYAADDQTKAEELHAQTRAVTRKSEDKS